MPPPPTTLSIEPVALEAMLVAYRDAHSVEPCGLLLGEVLGSVIRVREAPMTNNAHPHADRAFRIPPSVHLAMQRASRDRGLRIVGSWHGHLRGPAEPGQADRDGLDAAALPGRGSHAMLIVGRGEEARPVVRAYLLRADDVVEIRVERP